MKNVVFVTSNPHKAEYFAKLAGVTVDHHDVEVPEIQSLDLKYIAAEKARGAYAVLKKPVIIEDTALVIHSMGKLPGPLIKWFLDELGVERLCRLADFDPDRSATASSYYVYYDGARCRYFSGKLAGTLADHARGTSGFGWNRAFIPNGQNATLGEMSEKVFTNYYLQVKPIDQVGKFIRSVTGKSLAIPNQTY